MASFWLAPEADREVVAPQAHRRAFPGDPVAVIDFPSLTTEFDIEPAGKAVKLTVVHDDFEPGSILVEGVSGGWPVIIASLKTLLETGETLSVQPESESV